MAIYRIKPSGEQQIPPPLETQEYWRQVDAQQLEDIDLDEFADLNDSDFQEPELLSPMRKRWVMVLLALLVILSFIGWTAGDYLRLVPDLGFLGASAQLAKDESLAALREAVVVIEGSGGNGSGFNIAADGLIVTNKHVVEDSGIITVTFQSGEQKVFNTRDWVGVEGVDIALLDIDGEDLPAVQLGASLPQSGDDIIFIGNPLGYDWTISEGAVKGIVYIEQQLPVIYFSGPVHPGSSGSPVFDKHSQVIGVIFGSVLGEENSGLAIPISYLTEYLEAKNND
ncbi:MAG: serine protease [Bacillota bacterium]|nr:serine protease [Bacillota bacterium]